jgi:uncharacterized membrane protein YdjX (TVP38/TMEM64 family)
MRHLKTVLIAAIVLTVVIGVRFLPVEQWIRLLEDRIQQLGPIAPLVLIVGYVVTTVLLIPGSAVTVLAGSAFGLWKGLLVVVIGANLGALCSFLLARTFLREKVSRWAAANPRFALLDRAIEREGFRMVLLARLSPIFPFTLLNYLLGLTSVKTGSYVLANLIGMLPGTFLYIYIGVAARDTLAGGGGWRRTVIGLIVTLLLVLWITRIARRAMAQVESENESGVQPSSPAMNTS